MSALSCEQEYQQVLADLNAVQQEDSYITSVRIPNEANSRNVFFLQFWLSVYVRYVRVAQRLAVIHDVALHPQKRTDIRTLLDSCVGRMLETKFNIVANCGDMPFVDALMIDMKLTPGDIEVPIPAYFVEDRQQELEDRRNYLLSLQAHYAASNPEAPVSVSLQNPVVRVDPTKALPPLISNKSAAPVVAITDKVEETPMSLDEAVKVLQMCERGRQARQRVKFQLGIHRQQQYSVLHGQDFSTATGKDRAATVVQKVVQGYLERKRAARRYEEERRFLGMTATESTLSNTQQTTAGIRLQERKARQHMNESALRRQTVEIEERIKSNEAPKTMEDMLDEVLMHMAYARMESKDSGPVDFPTEEEGGSLQLLGRLPTKKKGEGTKKRSESSRSQSRAAGGGGFAGASLENGTGTFSGAAASTFKGDRLSIAGEMVASNTNRSPTTSGTAAKKIGRPGKDGDDAPPPLPPSTFWNQMHEGRERYSTIWKDKFIKSYVENGCLDQPADEEMIRKQLLEGPRGIMTELRKCVDYLVMMEVNNLKERMELERNAKRRKKIKKAKKPKRPVLKDVTKGVDLETAMNTALFENKLQLPPAEVKVADFIGEANLMASAHDHVLRTSKAEEETKKKWQKIIRNWNDEVEAALKMKRAVFEGLFEQYLKQSSRLRELSAAQIRQAVTEYAVLPLGSQVIHDLAPHPSAVLFYGFPASGKTMMAYAICNETGANFFNLSPANFQSIKGFAKTLQLVFYVARMKGPSVIYIDGIEKVFPLKKVGKKDPLLNRGKKMKKELLKGLASIVSTDRVLFIGTTSEPWLADTSAIALHFQRAVYFSLPNYGTRVVLIRHFLHLQLPTHSEPLPAHELQHLALLTESMAAGQLKTLVEETVHPRRVEAVLRRPLTASDFIPCLSRLKAIPEEQLEKMKNFHDGLPYTLRRANPAEDFKESEEDSKKHIASQKSKRAQKK